MIAVCLPTCPKWRLSFTTGINAAHPLPRQVTLIVFSSTFRIVKKRTYARSLGSFHAANSQSVLGPTHSPPCLFRTSGFPRSLSVHHFRPSV